MAPGHSLSDGWGPAASFLRAEDSCANSAGIGVGWGCSGLRPRALALWIEVSRGEYKRLSSTLHLPPAVWPLPGAQPWSKAPACSPSYPALKAALASYLLGGLVTYVSKPHWVECLFGTALAGDSQSWDIVSPLHGGARSLSESARVVLMSEDLPPCIPNLVQLRRAARVVYPLEAHERFPGPCLRQVNPWGAWRWGLSERWDFPPAVTFPCERTEWGLGRSRQQH